MPFEAIPPFLLALPAKIPSSLFLHTSFTFSLHHVQSQSCRYRPFLGASRAIFHGAALLVPGCGRTANVAKLHSEVGAEAAGGQGGGAREYSFLGAFLRAPRASEGLGAARRFSAAPRRGGRIDAVATTPPRVLGKRAKSREARRGEATRGERAPRSLFRPHRSRATLHFALSHILAKIC